MDFEEILANCLDALERGETIEGCLDRYPKHKAELLPLLQLASAVRSVPQPRLSAKSFARVRTAVVAQARYQHALRTPFTKRATRAQATLRSQRVRPPLPVQHQSLQQLTAQGQPAQRPHGFKSFGFVQRTTRAFGVLALLLCLITLTRNISISLPGSLLYPAKILGENIQGVLLTAAGEEVAWQAQQTENRLQELIALGQQGQIVDPAFLKTIDADVQVTLATSKNMPIAQRNQFLVNWLGHLQTLAKNQPMPALVIFTLDKALATVETATPVTIAPVTIAPSTQPLSQPKNVATTQPLQVSPAIILVPTPILTAAPPAVVKVAPHPVEATATKSMTAATNPALQFPMHAPEAPIVIETTPTAIPAVVQETNPNNAGQNNNNGQDSGHKHTARSQPEPTANPGIDPGTVAANPETANAAANSDTRVHSAKASGEISKSVGAPPDAIAPLATNATAVPAAQATLTADAATPSTPAAIETNAAGAPTRLLTPVGTSVHSGDLSPTPQSNNTVVATSPADSGNAATATSPATASTRATATPTSKKTPEATKTSNPTAQPTEASSSPETETPAAPSAPTDATSQATADAESQATPQPTAVATETNQKPHKGK